MKRLKNYLSRPEDQQQSSAIAYLAALDHIESAYPLIAQTIIKELVDERTHLKLIASENFSSLAVQLAMGNLLTDKYAEGYPKHRFYAGCDNIDTIEEAAQQELISLYGCEHAYVQPHSGADANLVALWSILLYKIQNPEIEKLGKKSLDELSAEEYENVRQLLVNQKLMGMSLNSGGHLTHGYKHNVSSKMFHSVLYDVDPQTEKIDYALLAKQVKEERPLVLLAGYSAHPCRLNFAKFREIADSVGAILLVDMAHFSGLVAGKVFQDEFDPVPYAHIVTSTTHKTLRGPRGGFILCKKELAESVNKGCPLVLGGPLPHVIAAKAIAFKEANTQSFRTYALKVVENAKFLADRFLKKGLRLVTGGTENHLMVLDISKFGLTGRQAETALREALITINRNAIPNDLQGPWYTSGIRLGTPALTTLGMGNEEMSEIADLIELVLSNSKAGTIQKSGQPSKATVTTDPAVLETVRNRVLQLLRQYPLYPEIELFGS
ncbi:MAG: glycine hydroxymethyltransferase [Candidatus Protochlamydia sp.]|nr:glycine hydroxymethyltransferase [Candidatus Protochlamydia sp.]